MSTSGYVLRLWVPGQRGEGSPFTVKDLIRSLVDIDEHFWDQIPLQIAVQVNKGSYRILQIQEVKPKTQARMSRVETVGAVIVSEDLKGWRL